MEDENSPPVSNKFISSRLGQAIIAALIAAFVLVVASNDFPKFFAYSGAHYKEQKASALVAFLHENENATTSPLLHVDRVVDGDTIDIAIGGGVATIRLIGINTPETVDPRKGVECFGPEASANAHGLMDNGEVHLELDPSQDTYDKYGRVLAYVFLPDGTFYNELAVQEGFAREYTYHSKYKYQKEFRVVQKEAKKEGRGLWGACE